MSRMTMRQGARDLAKWGLSRLGLDVVPPADAKPSTIRPQPPRTMRDEWLETWKNLNQPKAAMPEFVESVLSPLMRPETAIGPRAEHIRLEPARTLGEDAYRRLQELGLRPDDLDFDSAPFGREISPKLMKALETRQYESRSPYTGEPLSSVDTFLVCWPEGTPYVFVRFEAEERIFYDVYDGYGGARIGMYLPAENVVVSRLNLLKVVAYLKYAMLRHAFDVVRYLRSPERRTAVPINTMNHCGHWLLCEIEALRRIVDIEDGRLVDDWIDCMFHFIDTARLLPGIAPSSSAIGSDAIFRNSLSGCHFLVLPRLGHYFIGERAKADIRDYLGEHKTRSGYEALVRNRLADKWPVIWMEWRVNDRLWLNQKDGLAALLARMRDRYPDFAIVIAGWSRTNAERAGDEAMIEKEEAVFSEIRASVDAPELHFVSGESLANKLVWADNCDAYVAIYGTGLIFPLLADLHGVTVANRYDFLRLTSARTGLPEYVYGQREFLFAPEALISDVKTDQSAVRALTNFRIDPEGLIDLFEKEILQHLARPEDR